MGTRGRQRPRASSSPLSSTTPGGTPFDASVLDRLAERLDGVSPELGEFV